MPDNITKYIIFLRKQLIIWLTISMYILSIYYFFFETKIIWWLVFSIFLFSFAHFFIIEIKKTDISNLLLIVLAGTIFSLWIIWFNNIFYVVWIVIFNIAIFFLFWDIYEEVYNRIEISSYKVFTMWVKMFSLLLSLVFALSFLWTYRSFDITCNQIYNNIKKASNYSVKYFEIELPDIQDKKVKDVLTIWEKPQLNTWDNIINTWNIEKFNWIQNLKFKDLLSIDFWKNIVINQVMENKKVLDKWLCETIVQNIKDKYNKPQFQFTVLFFIFLLFYPFIRILLYILAIINFIAFKLMNIMKLYKFKLSVEDVETIE